MDEQSNVSPKCEESIMKVCQKCGEKNIPTNNFCQRCATPLGETVQAMQSQVIKPILGKEGQYREPKTESNKTGFIVIVVALLIFFAAYLHFPTMLWWTPQADIIVKFYEIKNYEKINESFRAVTGLYEPENGEPSSEELKQMLLEISPKCLSNLPRFEKISLIDNPLLDEAVIKLKEKANLGSKFVSIELSSIYPKVGEVIAGVIFILGLLLIALEWTSPGHPNNKTSLIQAKYVGDTKAIRTSHNYIKTPEQRICLNCGLENRDTAKFCRECGKTLPLIKASYTNENLLETNNRIQQLLNESIKTEIQEPEHRLLSHKCKKILGTILFVLFFLVLIATIYYFLFNL